MPAAACDAKRKPATCAQHAAKTMSRSMFFLQTCGTIECHLRLQSNYLHEQSLVLYWEMADTEDGGGVLWARVVLRRIAAGGLLCGLAGAAVAVGSDASGTAGQRAWLAQLGSQWSSEDGLRDSAPASMWRPFSVQGLNVGYSKLAPAFEAGALEAPPGSLALRVQPSRLACAGAADRFWSLGRLPSVGFWPVREDWNGTLPAFLDPPLRENEVKHPLTLRPYEHLSAVDQANISATHALEAAEVAKRAFAGGEGEKAATPAAEGETFPPAAAKTTAGTRMLAVLERTAATLTEEAQDAVKALNQAKLKMALKQAQKQAHYVSEYQGAVHKTEEAAAHALPRAAKRAVDLARHGDGRESAGGAGDARARDRAMLLAAKREVDAALQHLAAKHKALRSGQTEQRGEQGEQGAEDGGEEEEVQRRIARAQRRIYDHYMDEYQAAVHHTEERAAPLAEFRASSTVRSQSLAAGGAGGDGSGGRRQALNYQDAGVIAAKWKHRSYIATSGPMERASIVKSVPIRNWPLVGQYGHTHSWPYVAMDGDLVMQNEDPVVSPENCADDPIAVDCTGGFGGGVKSTGGPMNTRVQWRHDNMLGWRPEIDGPVRVAPELQDAWNTYYGYAGDARTVRDVSGGDSSAAMEDSSLNHDAQSEWDRGADLATPPAFEASEAGGERQTRLQQAFSRPRVQPFSPLAQ